MIRQLSEHIRANPLSGSAQRKESSARERSGMNGIKTRVCRAASKPSGSDTSGGQPCRPQTGKGDKVGQTMTATIERFLVAHRDKFVYVHITMFILFLLLYLVPPFLPLPADGATPWNNYFLFVKFAVWGLWFPLLLISIILFGRAWCGLFCPQGALSEYLDAKGGVKRTIPKWIKWEGTPIASFIIITILGQLVGVRDYPRPMLLIFGGTTVFAAIVGYRYKRGGRAWCRHLCPVGILLGNFSRLGIVGIERGGKNTVKVVCPTFINLSTKASARHCIECFRCVNPDQKGSLRLELRRPGKEIEEVRRHDPDLYEVFFLFLATGLALGGFHWITNPWFIYFRDFLGGMMIDLGLSGWIGASPPWWLAVNYPEAGEVFNWLDLISITSFMISAMLLIGSALLLLTILSALLLREEGMGVMDKVAVLGFTYAPVALISLILGLGAELFSLFKIVGFSVAAIAGIKIVILALAVLWSLYLNYKLIEKQKGYLAMLPNLLGVSLVLMAWYPVI